MTTSTVPAWCDPSFSREERIASVLCTFQSGWTRHYLTCPLCNSAGEPGECADRYGLPLALGTCAECDARWLSRQPDAKWYSQFYASGTYRKLVSAYHGRDVMATIRQEQEQYALRLVDHFSIPGLYFGSVLDIGSSTGVVGQWIAMRTNSRLTLVDPAAEFKNFDWMRIDTQEYCEPFETWKSTGPFTTVLLCQTIDHISRPVDCLNKIRGLLTDDGMFFMDILDFEQEVAQKGIEQTLKIDHPIYLTDKSARQLLNRTGFQVVDTWESAPNHIGYLCKGV